MKDNKVSLCFFRVVDFSFTFCLVVGQIQFGYIFYLKAIRGKIFCGAVSKDQFFFHYFHVNGNFFGLIVFSYQCSVVSTPTLLNFGGVSGVIVCLLLYLRQIPGSKMWQYRPPKFIIIQINI